MNKELTVKDALAQLDFLSKSYPISAKKRIFELAEFISRAGCMSRAEYISSYNLKSNGEAA